MDELERKYLALRKLGLELHVPIPEAFWTLEVFDKDGKLIQRYHQRSHSWVRNAYNMLFSEMAGKNADDDTFGAGKLNIKGTDGGVYYGNAVAGQRSNADLDGSTLQGYRAAAGQDGFGIIPGYGTAAESFEDYVLEYPIIEGTTDDGHHMSFAESEAHATNYAGLVFTNTLIRFFNNNEATNSVDINEVVLAMTGHVSDSLREFIVSRDKLPSTVTVPVNGQLKVTYTLQLTYPS